MFDPFEYEDEDELDIQIGSNIKLNKKKKKYKPPNKKCLYVNKDVYEMVKEKAKSQGKFIYEITEDACKKVVK